MLYLPKHTLFCNDIKDSRGNWVDEVDGNKTFRCSSIPLFCVFKMRIDCLFEKNKINGRSKDNTFVIPNGAMVRENYI